MRFTAVFRQVPEGYIAFVEELLGANTQGATLRDARELGRGRRAHSRSQPHFGEGVDPGSGCHSRVVRHCGSTKWLELVRHLQRHGCELLR